VHVTLNGQRDFADVTEGRLLGWRDCVQWSKDILNEITSIPIGGRLDMESGNVTTVATR
jgi:hypothetical protein